MRRVTFQFSGPIATAHYDSGERKCMGWGERAVMKCGATIPMHVLRTASSNLPLCKGCEEAE